jgi:hypothetical protein
MMMIKNLFSRFIIFMRFKRIVFRENKLSGESAGGVVREMPQMKGSLCALNPKRK